MEFKQTKRVISLPSIKRFGFKPPIKFLFNNPEMLSCPYCQLRKTKKKVSDDQSERCKCTIFPPLAHFQPGRQTAPHILPAQGADKGLSTLVLLLTTHGMEPSLPRVGMRIVAIWSPPLFSHLYRRLDCCSNNHTHAPD